MVSILVLMDLCIKTLVQFTAMIGSMCFNPCFNGSMYKNYPQQESGHLVSFVSILVLMDLCIKTSKPFFFVAINNVVSILVLMDLCIKTISGLKSLAAAFRFNPCFNGSMYKNLLKNWLKNAVKKCFNPCFNGSMYKNSIDSQRRNQMRHVSILVLMDLCIKTIHSRNQDISYHLFQSLF